MKNKKKVIIIGVLIIIGICLITIIILKSNVFKNNKDNIVINKGKPVVEEIEVESNKEISVISARIEKLDNLSNIFVKIQNNTGSDIDKCDLKLTAFDNDNNIVLESYIKDFDNFKKESIEEFQVSSTNDLSKASVYKVEKVIK